MGRAIAVVVTAITVASVWAFWSKHWWLPADISTHGAAIDRQFNLTFIITGIIFVLAQIGLAYMVWRYRERGAGGKANYYHGNNVMELTWTVTTAIIFIGLNLMGYRIWANIQFVGAAPGAVQVEVWGQQFQWYFHYPGSDGQFGAYHVDKVDDATGNFLGLDREHDPAARDDIVTSTLAVPVNRPLQLILRSKDVTHSFFVRELRVKQDLVPGLQIPIHFTATQTGRYEIACAELCGLGHYRMRAFMQVMSAEDFQKWLAGMAAQQAQ